MLYTFSQNDPAWRDLVIPGTNLTLGQAGCIVCCAAEVACAAGHMETPATILPKLKFKNGLFVWQSLTDLYPDIIFKERIKNPSAEKIQNWLNTDNPVIVQVNISREEGKFKEHWMTYWSFDKLLDGISAAAFYEIKKAQAPHPEDLQIENADLRQENFLLKTKIALARDILA